MFPKASGTRGVPADDQQGFPNGMSRSHAWPPSAFT